MGVYIRPGVLGLSVLGQDLGGNLVDGRDEVEQVVVRHVLEGKLTLSSVTGVSLSQNGMAVTGNNTTSVQSVPEVLLNVFLGDVGSNLGLNLKEPFQDLLVGTSVKGTGKTVKTSGKRKEGGGESGTNQVSGVGRNVTTLVVSVDSKVKSQELNELTVLAKSKLGSKVLGVIGGGIDSSELTIFENVAVNSRSDTGELGEEVNGILVGVLPVLLLVDTSLVSLGERRLGLESVDSNRKLSHGMQRGRAVINQLLDVLGKLRSSGKLGRESLDLRLGRDLTGQQKPEETFGKGLIATGALRELLLKIGDSLSTETNTLFRVEDRTFPDESLDTTLATIDLVEEDFTNDGVAMFLSKLLNLVNLLGEKLSEAFFKGLKE